MGAITRGAPAFNPCMGQAVMHGVWRARARNEGANLRGRSTASLLRGLAKCYEHMNHSKVCQTGRKRFLSLVLLRVDIASFR